MENTFASRVKLFRESKGLAQAAFAERCMLTQGNVSQMEQGTEPKQSNVSKILLGFPDLNPDWLLVGTGPMLRDGKTLTPLPEPARPAPIQTQPGQIDFVQKYITNMEQQLAAGAEREADQRAQIEDLLEMLKKPLGNLTHAAAEPEVAYTQTDASASRIGFPVKGSRKPEAVMREMWPTSEPVEITPQRVAVGQ